MWPMLSLDPLPAVGLAYTAWPIVAIVVGLLLVAVAALILCGSPRRRARVVGRETAMRGRAGRVTSGPVHAAVTRQPAL